MNANALYKEFSAIFGELAMRTERFSQLDRRTIKLYLRNGWILVFRWHSRTTWNLMTLNEYKNN